MSTQITIVIVAALALVAFTMWLALKYVSDRPDPSASDEEVNSNDIHLSRTLVVHTTDSQSVRGIECQSSAPDSLSLRNAVFLAPGGSETSLAGIIHIATAKVSFVQEIGHVSDAVATHGASTAPAKPLSVAEGA